MTDEEMDLMIKDAMEVGITHTLIPSETADRMRARLTQVLGGEINARDHQDDCLMCAVRALTEGEPAIKWTPTDENNSVSGVVLRVGECGAQFGTIPFVDLWMGGGERIRIRVFSDDLQRALSEVSPTVGDRLTVNYDGVRTVRGQYGERPYRMFSAIVRRGH